MLIRAIEIKREGGSGISQRRMIPLTCGNRGFVGRVPGNTRLETADAYAGFVLGNPVVNHHAVVVMREQGRIFGGAGERRVSSRFDLPSFHA